VHYAASLARLISGRPFPRSRDLDGLGNGSVIRSGDVQRMSAGSGISHSEFNASRDDPVHFSRSGFCPPGGASCRATSSGISRKLKSATVIGDPNGSDGAVRIRQDVRLYAACLGTGHSRMANPR
jgi:hypothetical protein